MHAVGDFSLGLRTEAGALLLQASRQTRPSVFTVSWRKKENRTERMARTDERMDRLYIHIGLHKIEGSTEGGDRQKTSLSLFFFFAGSLPPAIVIAATFSLRFFSVAPLLDGRRSAEISHRLPTSRLRCAAKTVHV